MPHLILVLRSVQDVLLSHYHLVVPIYEVGIVLKGILTKAPRRDHGGLLSKTHFILS